MEDKKSYLQQLADTIVEWDKKIDDLKKKGNEASAVMRQEYLNMTEELKAKKLEAEEKIKQLKANSGDGWEEIKKGAEKAIGELSEAFNRALSKFKQ